MKWILFPFWFPIALLIVLVAGLLRIFNKESCETQ